MVYYVKTVRVQYGDSTRAIDGGDINKGFGGEYVYLIAEYTFKREEAAYAFSLLTTYNEDLCAADLAKGDGRPLYRYIRTLWRNDNSEAVTRVWLSRTQDTTEGDGRTGNINADRGGDFLYLCWEYGYAPDYEHPTVANPYATVANSYDYKVAKRAVDEEEDPWVRSVAIEDVFSSSEFRDYVTVSNPYVTAGNPYAAVANPHATVAIANPHVTVANSYDYKVAKRAIDEEEDPCVRPVAIEDIVFSQNSISSEFRDGDDIKKIIDTLRAMSNEDRKAIVDLFPILNVVPIPFAGQAYLLSCDNRRLHIFRSVLDPGTTIFVQNASRAERDKLKKKWTSKNGGLFISVRNKKKAQGNKGDL